MATFITNTYESFRRPTCTTYLTFGYTSEWLMAMLVAPLTRDSQLAGSEVTTEKRTNGGATAQPRTKSYHHR